MINTVWRGFQGFYVAFVIKRLLCIEFKVFGKKEKKVGGEEMAQRGYCQFSGLGHNRGFFCCDRVFLALCRDIVLCVAT